MHDYQYLTRSITKPDERDVYRFPQRRDQIFSEFCLCISFRCSLTTLRRVNQVANEMVMKETTTQAIKIPTFFPISFFVLKMISNQH